MADSLPATPGGVGRRCPHVEFLEEPHPIPFAIRCTCTRCKQYVVVAEIERRYFRGDVCDIARTKLQVQEDRAGLPPLA